MTIRSHGIAFGLTAGAPTDDPDDKDLLYVDSDGVIYEPIETRTAGALVRSWKRFGELPTGSSSSGASIWNPDAQPASPHALDYEAGDGLAGWGIYDHDDEATIGESDSGLYIHAPAQQDAKVFGVYKSLSGLGSEWSAWTKLCSGLYMPGHTDLNLAGLALWEDATDYTKKIFIVGTVWPPTIKMHHYTDYQTRAGAVETSPVDASWYRLRNTGSGFEIDISANQGLSGGIIADGLGEVSVWGALASFIDFTPQHIGFAFDANYSELLDIGFTMVTGPTFPYFRIVESDVGMLAPFEGRMLRIPFA